MTMYRYNSRDSGTSDVLLFIAGAGLGIGLGMLLAPKAGHETRDAIRGKVNDGKDYLTRQGRDLSREIANKASTLADKASGLAEKGKETIDKHRSSVAAAVDAGRQAYRETVSTV
jgi:gas vesicle protein